MTPVQSDVTGFYSWSQLKPEVTNGITNYPRTGVSVVLAGGPAELLRPVRTGLEATEERLPQTVLLQ